MPNTRRPAAVVVSIYAPCPVSTRRPTPRADRSCTVLTSGCGCGRGDRPSKRRARRQSGSRARSCRTPGGRRGRRTRSRGKRGPRRRARPAVRCAAGPATGSRPPFRRGRSRSAYRKRSFGTDGRGRRPARAAVCRILCLAYVKRVCQCRAPNAPAAPARSHDRYSWGTDRAALKRWWSPITSPRRLQNPRPRREVRCSTPAPPDSAGWQLSLSGAARPRRQSSRPADRGGRVVVR